MLGDVIHTITDFGIGSITTKGEGVHIKIGVSNKISNIPISITGNMTFDDIKEKVGSSPLADSLIDSLNAGCSTIYAVPIASSVDGIISEESKSMTTGAITLTGKPTNKYKIKIEIVGSGARNIGIFKYYINDLESDEYIIPQEEVHKLEEVELNINFSEEEYTAKDYINFRATKPKTSIQNILKALENIKNNNLDFEFIHIVGESEKELWASLTVEEDNFFNKEHKPCIFVVEARNIREYESIDNYAQYLRNERKNITSRGLQIVVGRCTYIRSGKEININASSLIMGLFAKSKVNQSIGQVDSFDIVGALKLMPKGIENIINEMDNLGYTMLREYAGINGIYVNNARTMAKVGSDYEFTERTRTMYKAVRETRKTALLKMHSEMDMSNTDKSIKQITEFINVPVEKMVDNEELSKARVIIPKGQDILGTSRLKFKIRAIPIGILREIEIDMGFINERGK